MGIGSHFYWPRSRTKSIPWKSIRVKPSRILADGAMSQMIFCDENEPKHKKGMNFDTGLSGIHAK